MWKKLQYLYDRQKEFRTELVKPTCSCVHFFVFLQTIIIIIIITVTTIIMATYETHVFIRQLQTQNL